MELFFNKYSCNVPFDKTFSSEKSGLLLNKNLPKKMVSKVDMCLKLTATDMS